MEKVTTWVVVADATRARVLENIGPGSGLVEVPEAVFEGPNRPDRKIVSDRPGRSFDSHGHGRHAMEPDTDPARYEKQQFAREIAAWLDKAARRGDFDRIAIVAAPRTLGDLRATLSHVVQERMVCDLAKDLTMARPAAIVDALGDKIRL